MISKDRFSYIVDQLAQELPDIFYDRLNGGIHISDEEKLHPASLGSDLYTLGEYQVDSMSRKIVLYYGSFMRNYGQLDEESLTKHIRHVLRHEFRHHLESMAGEHGLEEIDRKRIASYLKKFT